MEHSVSLVIINHKHPCRFTQGVQQRQYKQGKLSSHFELQFQTRKKYGRFIQSNKKLGNLGVRGL